MTSTYSRVLALVLVLAAAACEDDGSEVQSVAPAPIPASDVDLIDNMVPHHEMAMQMADIELARGTREDVKAMAAMMKEEQAQEVMHMRAIRARLDGSATVPDMEDPHAELDMKTLNSAAGDAVDMVFLMNMVPHHADAVSLAHRALENLSDPELRGMAEETVVKQTREMNEMLDMMGK